MFAILLKDGEQLSTDTLFPFSQVTLAHAARALEAQGIAVEVTGINADRIVLCSEGKHFCAGADFTGRAKAAMDHELAEQQKLWQTEDFAEGVRASAERRPAQLEGQ